MTILLWVSKRTAHETFKMHVVWSQTLKYSVKLYVTRASTKYYIDEYLFMQGPQTR